MSLGLIYAVLPALVFWFLGGAVVDLFLDPGQPGTAGVKPLAVSFLAVAALFQFADCAQVTIMGGLRGLKDTTVPMLFALAGYWGLGLPSAAYFGLYLGFGGQGVWGGLALGLTAVCLCLIARFRLLSRRAIQ